MLETKHSGTSENSQEASLIEFAPLKIPLKRRLETLSAVIYMLIWSLAIIGPISILYLLCFTSHWYLAVFYLSWLYYDRKTPRSGGRRSNWFRNLTIWKWFGNYFPVKLIKSSDFDPTKNYLLGYHPHGMFSSGLHGAIGTEAAKIGEIYPSHKFHFVTLDANFKVPFFREIALACGGCSVAKESLNYLLNKEGGGNAVTVVIGGAREALYSQPGTHVVYLKKRKGFIKIAIQNGSPLVPIYSFGETDLFSQPLNPKGSVLRKFQEKCVDLLGAVPIFVKGRGIFQYTFGLLPKRKAITVVVGTPIPVEKKPSPTQEYIDLIHDKYVKHLEDLFYGHREKYATPSSELVIV